MECLLLEQAGWVDMQAAVLQINMLFDSHNSSDTKQIKQACGSCFFKVMLYTVFRT